MTGDSLFAREMARRKDPTKQETQAAATAAVTDWREGTSRSERARLIREALFNAAGEVVGERGYQDASISLITQRAGVAQGTFYNHFESRQDILDQLLPALGKAMLQHVGECSREGSSFIDREIRGFRGFFSFLKTQPHFFRILNEASSFAPKGYQAHLEMVMEGYMRFLRKGCQTGEVPNFSDRELEVVAYVLMGARLYLGHYATQDDEHDQDVPDWVVEAYRKLVTHGLTGK